MANYATLSNSATSRRLLLLATHRASASLGNLAAVPAVRRWFQTAGARDGRILGSPSRALRASAPSTSWPEPDYFLTQTGVQPCNGILGDRFQAINEKTPRGLAQSLRGFAMMTSLWQVI